MKISILSNLLLNIVTSKPVMMPIQDHSLATFNSESATHLTIAVIAPCNRWTAIGFGSSMTNTDMVVVGNNEDGVAYVQDLWSTGHSKPKPDQ